jgi:hypothetical protein
LQLLGGRVPWPQPVDLPDLQRRAQVAAEGGGGVATYRLDLPPERGAGRLLLRLQDGRLERLEWWEGEAVRLEVDYDRWRSGAGAPRPGRMRVRAPRSGVRAEVSFDRLEVQRGFQAADFEVGG